jgi:hypothetical protein
MRLKSEIEGCGVSGSGQVTLRRLKPEHRDGVLAGSGGQAAEFELAGIIGNSCDLVGTADRRHRGAWNRLPAGAYNTTLGFRGGGCCEHGCEDK